MQPASLPRAGVPARSAVLCAPASAAQSAAARARAQDHRRAPPHRAARDYLAETRARQNPPVINWSVQKSIEDMDQAGVATSITSITTPGVWFGDDQQASRLARACNDYAARLVQDHRVASACSPSLPLPNVDASLREIEYAFGHAEGGRRRPAHQLSATSGWAIPRSIR